MYPMKYIILLYFFLLTLLVRDVSSQFVEAFINNTGVSFNEAYSLIGIKGNIDVYAEWSTTIPGAHHASVELRSNVTAVLVSYESFFNESFSDSNITGHGTVNLSSLFIGYNRLNVTIYDIDNNILGSGVEPITVLLAYARLNNIFAYILTFLIVCMYVNMGATIDLEIVKGIVKKPIGPLVGVLCQYGIMPLIAFGLAKAFFPGDPYMQLGMFLNGASPGGGNSNMWTLLLGGSLDLSIMMTFTSTIFAFAAMPLWVLTMGPLLVGEDSEFTIPYSRIAMLVVSLLIPCSFGIFIQKMWPKVAYFMKTRVLRPFAFFNLAFIFSFGAYANRYLFVLMNWRVFLAAFSLPALGYMSGLTLSLLVRRSMKEIIAITIETGVQNAAIAIIILKVTLEAPAGDLTVVIPACTFLMTPIPLFCVLIGKNIYGYFAKSGGKDLPSVEEPKKPKIEMISNGIVSTNQVSIPEYSSKDFNGVNGTTGQVTNRKLSGIDNPAAVMNDE